MECEQTKKCTKCGEVKSLGWFYKNKSKHDGLHNQCRPCANAASAAYRKKDPERARMLVREWCKRNKHKERETAREWRRSNPEATKKISRAATLALYGMQESDFKAMLAAQGDVCGVCGRPFAGGETPCVDHCHGACPNLRTASKEQRRASVRGIVHNKCNTAIGLLGESTKNFKSAIAYLDKWQHKHKEQIECN